MVLSHCLPSLLSVSSCVFYVYHSPKWRRKSFSFCLTNSQPTLSFLFSFFRLCILVAHFELSSFCKRLFLVCFICPASTIERNKNLPEKSQKCMCTRNPFSEPHFKRLNNEMWKSFVFSLVYSLLCWFLVIVVAVRFENGKEKNKEEGGRSETKKRMQTKNNKMHSIDLIRNIQARTATILSKTRRIIYCSNGSNPTHTRP